MVKHSETTPFLIKCVGKREEVFRHLNKEGKHFPGRCMIKAMTFPLKAYNNFELVRCEFGPSVFKKGNREIGGRRSGETGARKFTRACHAVSHMRYVFRMPEYTPVC